MAESSRCSQTLSNVRVGSIADSQRRTDLRPLLGDKRTSNVRYSALASLMSAYGGKADVRELPSECLLIATSGVRQDKLAKDRR